MFLTIAAVLFVLWILGLIGHIGGGFVNLLIVIAIVSLVVHFLRGRGHTTV